MKEKLGLAPRTIRVYSIIKNLKGREILKEFKGMRPVDLDFLAATVIKFLKMIEEIPEKWTLIPSLGPEKIVLWTLLRLS